MYRMVLILLAFGGTVFFAGCNTQYNDGAEGTAWGSGAFDSNGERIYFTGTSERGTAITYTGGPSMGMMIMGGKFACASCHGTDAQGGKHRMRRAIMNAPDIRWFTLAGGHHHGGEETGHPHADETVEQQGDEAPYSFADFRNAVENGQHPDGDELRDDMPHWRMSDEDLHDLADYLQSLK